MQGKHTPGPWTWTEYNDERAIHAECGTKIALPEVWRKDSAEESEANAALIASAPELLGMLGEAVRLAGEGRAMSGDTLRAARALMMKAVGLVAMAVSLSGCATAETRYAVEYRADAARPAEGVIVAGVSGGFSSVLR